MRRGLAAAIVLGAALVVLMAGPTAAETTATSGPRILTVSRTADLEPAGDTVDVRGSGYDERHGIYLAFCVVNGPNVAPGPCGGGIDTAGTGGSSAWISSDPPPYGQGLATPFGPGGSFALSLRVAATIGTDVDCTVVSCAVITRNDHTRSDDRGQDVIVPVTFRAGAAGPASLVSAGPGPWIAIGLAVAVVVGVAVMLAMAWRGSRRASRAAHRGDPSPGDPG